MEGHGAVVVVRGDRRALALALSETDGAGDCRGLRAVQGWPSQLQRKLTLGLLDKLVDQLTVEINDPEHET